MIFGVWECFALAGISGKVAMEAAAETVGRPTAPVVAEVLDVKIFQEHIQHLCSLLLDAKAEEIQAALGSTASQEHLTKFVTEGHEPVLFLQRLTLESGEISTSTLVKFDAHQPFHLRSPPNTISYSTPPFSSFISNFAILLPVSPEISRDEPLH